MIEHWKCQWFHDERKEWITSATCDTEREAKAQLAANQSYFYKRIKLRIVYWQGIIVCETNGMQ